MTERPILEGFMVLDGWAEDYSDWDGVITGPANPKGANLYWHNPIPMIERRAYDSLRARVAELESENHVLSVQISRYEWDDKRVKELEAENAKLKERKCSHGPYEMYGTDGCARCETGRIEMYRLSSLCICCQRDGHRDE